MEDQRRKVVIAASRASGFPVSAFDEEIELEFAHTDDQLRAAVRSANVLYSWRIPDIVPAKTPELRWIQLPSAGVDHIEGSPVWESDIVITASQGIHTVPMTEHLFAMILAQTRQIAALTRAQVQGEWLHDTQAAHMRLTELHGKTMGILGWGKIGDGVAHMARALGMRVIGTRWSVMVPREEPGRSEMVYSDPPWVEPVDAPPDILYPAVQMHEVLSQSDVVVLILPLTEETRGSIGTAEFRSMRRHALFCNIGRGQVVDQDALIHALRTARIAGACLDVFPQEPLPRSSPLWGMHNVIISPHVGGMSDQTAERANRLFAVNLTRYLNDQPLLNVVDRSRGY